MGYAPLASPTFTGTITLPGTGTNQIGAGTGDGASYTIYDFYLKGWYGMALKDYSDTVRGVYDFRLGALTLDGNITSRSLTIPNLAGYGTHASPTWTPGLIGLENDLAHSAVISFGNVATSSHGSMMKFTVNSSYSASTPIDAMIIDYFGNILIGQTTGSEKLCVTGNALLTGGITAGTNSTFVTSNGNSIVIGVTGSPTMQLGNNGTYMFFYNNTTTRTPLTINNTTDNVGISTSLSVTGNIYSSGEVTAYYSSDRRLKQNIQSFSALDVIDKMKPVTFEWNDKAKELNSSKDDRNNFGLIAQEVKQILPELVHSIYEEYEAVDYIAFIPILIQGMKELMKEIETLKNESKRNI
jgi:hypothetical protein